MNPSGLLEEAENCFKQGKIREAAQYALKAKPHRDQYGYLASYIIHMGLVNRKSFYKMLRIDDPYADEDTLRKAYSEMVTVLLPHRNRSVAAPNALRIMNAAWEVLSDSEKRTEYNQKRGYFGKISDSSPGESETGSNRVTESEAVNSYHKSWAEEEVDQPARRRIKTEPAELEGSNSNVVKL